MQAIKAEFDKIVKSMKDSSKDLIVYSEAGQADYYTVENKSF